MLPGIRDKTGLVAALCLAAFGGYVIYTGAQLPYVAEIGPGPGIFPLWIGIGLLLFSCYQTFLCLSGPRQQSVSARSNWRGSGRARAGSLATIGTDFFSAESRFTFGQAKLLGGIDFIADTGGMFAIGEVLMHLQSDTGGAIIKLPRGL